MSKTDVKVAQIHVVADPESDPELLDEFFERFGALDGLQRPSGVADAAASVEQLRADRIGAATVTIVLLGTCTWSRAGVDVEIEAALTPGADGLPNGLLALTLDRNAERSKMPERLKRNVESGYARLYRLPRTVDELAVWVAEAETARSTRTEKLRQTEDRLAADLPCTDTGVW